MKDDRVNPIVFVVGCPRSGTTLLQRMLDNHPLLAVANDTHFIPRALYKNAPAEVSRALEGRAIPLNRNLIDGLLHYRRFPRLGVDREVALDAARDSTTYSEWVARLYSTFAAGRGKPYGGEKTPDYVRYLPLLQGLFPAAKFLHIVRDGRDVALSTLDWAGPGKGPGKWELWEREPLAACALWWSWQVETGRRDSRALTRGSYAEVRYEHLVVDPAAELCRISGFLNLPYDESMLRFHSGKTRAVPGKSAKSNWLPVTRGLRDWSSQMTPDDQALFDEIAGDTLSACHLSRTPHPATPSVRRRAEECMEWWGRFIARRNKKVQRRLEGHLERHA